EMRNRGIEIHLGAGVDLDAAVAHFQGEADPDVVVEAVQQFLAPDHLDDLAAEAAEDAGELDRDVAAADDDYLARQLRQIERLVRGDDMLDAGNGRHGRMPAGGDQDVLGGVGAAGDFDRVRIDQHAAALNDLNRAILQHVDVDLLEPIEFLVLGADQVRPVEFGRRDGPAETGGIGESVGELRAIDEELFRHAAAQHAGAADTAFLDDRDARTITPGAARGGDAARAGADRDHVEIIARHAGSLRHSGSIGLLVRTTGPPP